MPKKTKQKTEKTKKRGKCSNCRRTGHNARTCMNPTRN